MKLISNYDNYLPPVFSPHWNNDLNKVFFCDEYIPQCEDEKYKESTKYALLIEPRTISQVGYDYILNDGWKNFKYVFTSNDEVLEKCPNAKPIHFMNVWCHSNRKKTKDVCMITSLKRMCPLHEDRIAVANELKDVVDVFGLDGNFTNPSKIHAPYRFEIVFENDIQSNWMTEKLANCFATKTIPIYLGGSKALELFNKDGIIFISNPHQAKTVISMLRTFGYEWYYNTHLDAVNDNYERVKQYNKFEDWFFKTYGEMINND